MNGVIVVDENREHADLLALLFAQLGYETRAAYDVLQTLRHVAATVPEILFIDLDMPGMNGLELARQLAPRPADDRPRLVALTADVSASARQLALDAGFDNVVVKPAEFELLLSLFNSPWRASQQ